jgi:hypothetical protein
MPGKKGGNAQPEVPSLPVFPGYKALENSIAHYRTACPGLLISPLAIAVFLSPKKGFS